MKYILIYISCLYIMISCKHKEPNPNQVVNQVSDPVIAGISQLIDDQPNNTELIYERANLLYQRERYADAEQDLVKAIALNAKEPMFYHLLADVQLDNNKSKDAIETLNSAVELFPTRIPTLLKLIEYYYLLKKHQESIATINEVIRQDPQNADAYFMLGLNFRSMQDTIKALNSLQRAVEIDADMIDAWLILGSIYEEKGQSIALKYYENAIDIDPNNIEGLHSKAYYLQNQSKEIEAIEIYKKINVLAPTYEDAYLNTGILYMSLDSFQQAYEHFNVLSGIDPSNGMAYYYRGISQELLGNFEAALSDYNSANRLIPENDKILKALTDLGKELKK